MRIISQDGNVDLPYESAVIICEEWVIRAEVNDKVFCMGAYSTPEKAQAVMMSINEAHPCYVIKQGKAVLGSMKNNVFRFPPDEVVMP